MTRSATSKTVTIFEGPDGGGKSTIAQEYAQLTQARYVHHGPYKQVGDGLGRMFVESILPALLGYEDVVLDRCWISEPIYADVFRHGDDRVGPARSRILDRLALRCGAVVVKCLPPWAHVKSTFNGRKDEEYLDDDRQLLQVYGQYQHDLNTNLHELEHDYTHHLGESLASVAGTRIKPLVEQLRAKSPPHSIRVRSTGNWNAKVVIVGEDFGEHKNNDALYQHPFGSLNGTGCSLWLSDQLDRADISEQSLMWVNADELERVPEFVEWHDGKRFITLGDKASEVVGRLHAKLPGYTRTHLAAPHPQYWKRFQNARPYPLIGILKETLHDAYTN